MQYGRPQKHHHINVVQTKSISSVFKLSRTRPPFASDASTAHLCDQANMLQFSSSFFHQSERQLHGARRPAAEGKSQRETTSTNKARPALKNGTFIANNKLITRDISQCRIAGIRRELATQGLLPLFEKNRRKNE